ncbi:MAG: hypothetical protein R2716_14270 [Microthrixaceae bacterium]
MLRNHRTAPLVERVLTVPDDFTVRRSGSHWVVVGHTGLFLIGKAGPSPEVDAERTAMGAHRLRSSLAEVLDSVPFVDPVLVSSVEGHVNGCAMVEPELLESFVAHGPRVVSDPELLAIRTNLPTVVASIERDGGFG